MNQNHILPAQRFYFFPPLLCPKIFLSNLPTSHLPPSSYLSLPTSPLLPPIAKAWEPFGAEWIAIARAESRLEWEPNGSQCRTLTRDPRTGAFKLQGKLPRLLLSFFCCSATKKATTTLLLLPSFLFCCRKKKKATLPSPFCFFFFFFFAS